MDIRLFVYVFVQNDKNKHKGFTILKYQCVLQLVGRNGRESECESIQG